MVHPTAESNGSDLNHDASSMEYIDGPTYSINFERKLGVELEETFLEDVASVTTHGSDGYDDVASDPPPPRGGDDSSDDASPYIEQVQAHVPPMIDLTFIDDSSYATSIPASRSIRSASTTITRHSSITIDSISKIDHAFKDSLTNDFVNRFEIYLPDHIDVNSATKLKMRLEDRLHSAYRQTFEYVSELRFQQVITSSLLS